MKDTNNIKLLKKQLYIAIIVLFAAGIAIYILKKRGSTRITFADFLPLIGFAVYLGYQNYQNYQVYKKQSHLYTKKIEGIDMHHSVAFDNLLISKSETNNDLILVRNELFWFDQKEYTNSDETVLMENLISDFKKLSDSNKYFRQKMEKHIIQFSLVDNVNYDNKILVEKRIEFNKL